MLPTELFALRILSSLIPKSVRAGVALAITLVALPVGLNELSNVLLEQASAWGMIRCIAGIVIGAVAGVTFYYFQGVDAKTKAGDLEIISQYHKDHRRNFEVAWSTEEHEREQAGKHRQS